MGKATKNRKTKNTLGKKKLTSRKSPEELLKVFANIMVDRIIEDYQKGNLPVRSNTSG